MMKLKALALRGAGGFAAVAASGLAFAQDAGATAIDTTAVTGAITDAATAVGVIGSAVLVVIVGIAAYKWLRRAI